jgi:hypothetical protein
VGDFLLGCVALYPLWVGACLLLRWRAQRRPGPAPALGPDPFRLAVLLPVAAGGSCLFFFWPLLVWGWGAWPYPALLLFLFGGFALGRQWRR